jgi:hypothetical protein
MQPRIYLYKITFEEIPDWYWGVHKEKKYGEPYLGSPETHAWKWEFYTSFLQICEFFPYTEEGWVEAQNVENRCIKPDLNNPLCLNEHYGSVISSEASRRGAKKTHKEKDELGRSVHAIKNNKIMHKEKDDLGRSVHAVKMGEASNEEKDELGRSVNAVKGATACHKEKDDLGRSVTAVKAGTSCHKEKDDLGRSVNGVKAVERMHAIIHRERDDLGRSVNGVKSAERLNEDKDDLGRSVKAVKGGKRGAKTMHAQKWKDPDHPELGEHSPGTLVQMQKRRGYPYGKENRVKVG